VGRSTPPAPPYAPLWGLPAARRDAAPHLTQSSRPKLYLKLRMARAAKPGPPQAKPLNLCINPAVAITASWRAPSLYEGVAQRPGIAGSRRPARLTGVTSPTALAEPRAKRAPIGRRSEGAASRAGRYSFPILALLCRPAVGAAHA
jgi:hypothetical protein